MSLLKWLYTELGAGNPPPDLVYNVLRGVMFLLTFVLEDWAIYEFVPSPRHRQATIVLVASSYVTWTFQTHTFSNSLETLLVAWGLVLIRRIVENKVCIVGCREVDLLLIWAPSSDALRISLPPCLHSFLWPVCSIASLSRPFSSFRGFDCCLTFVAS